jgi:hypothetical protein
MKKYIALLISIFVFALNASAQPLLQFTFEAGKTFYLLLGTYDLSIVLSCFIFAFTGSVVSIYVRGLKGVKTNESSPDKFNVLYLIKDKVYNFVTGLLLVAITLRFGSFKIVEWAKLVSIDEVYALILFSFFVGFFNYLLGNIIFKFGKKMLGGFGDKIGIDLQNESNGTT